MPGFQHNGGLKFRAVVHAAVILARSYSRPWLRRPPWRKKPVSNLDESKVGPYTLPDPLMSAGGRKGRDERPMERRATARAPAPFRDPGLRQGAAPRQADPAQVSGQIGRPAGPGWNGHPPRSVDRVFRQARRSSHRPLALPAQEGRREPPRPGVSRAELPRETTRFTPTRGSPSRASGCAKAAKVS